MVPKFNIGDMIETKNMEVGRVTGIRVTILYGVECPEYSFYVSQKYEDGRVVRDDESKCKLVKGIPEFYKYRSEPIVGCVFVEDGNKYIIEEIGYDTHSCGDCHSLGGSSTSVSKHYICRNLKTNKQKKFDDKRFNVIDIKKVAFV